MSQKNNNIQTWAQYSAGFTLLELLVAVSIFSIISLVAFTSLTQVQRANAHTESVMKRLNQIQLAVRKLEQDISQMTLRPARDRYGEQQPAIINDSDKLYLEFTRSGADPFINRNKTRFLRVAYYLQNDTLYRQIWHQLDLPDQVQPEFYPILSRIKSIQLRFLDDKNQSHLNWPPNNMTTIELPLAIEIEMELEQNGRLKRIIEIKDLNP